MRIVSLLPSATEIVCNLGLGRQLVGVTHECDYPPFVQALPKVTRSLIPDNAPSREIDSLVRQQLRGQRALYSLDLEVLERLRPDLIVTQALCEVCAVAEEEVSRAACVLPGNPRVINLEPRSLGDVFECMMMVAEAAGAREKGVRMVERLQQRVARVAQRTAAVTDWPRVVLLEWIDPPFASGHWSPELVAIAGGVEVIGKAGEPSRTIRWEEVLHADPDVLFIACCGLTAERAWQDLPILASYPHFDELACARQGRIFLTDGNWYFSRPGPRLVDSLEILAHGLHPTVHLPPTAAPIARKLSRSELAGAELRVQ
jgi:iron complex transport system substrate-binding protein